MVVRVAQGHGALHRSAARGAARRDGDESQMDEQALAESARKVTGDVHRVGDRSGRCLRHSRRAGGRRTQQWLDAAWEGRSRSTEIAGVLDQSVVAGYPYA